jgi:hypothetical protein
MSFHDDHALETYKSMISVSTEGLKTLLLINGGAVVAMLAYLGQSSQGAAVAPHAWGPLAFFIAGIFFCVLAFVGSYITQFVLFNEVTRQKPDSESNHMGVLWTAVVFVALSLICFAAGAFTSVRALAKYGSVSSATPHVPTCIVK